MYGDGALYGTELAYSSAMCGTKQAYGGSANSTELVHGGTVHGTELAYGGTMRGSELAYRAHRCRVLFTSVMELNTWIEHLLKHAQVPHLYTLTSHP